MSVARHNEKFAFMRKAHFCRERIFFADLEIQFNESDQFPGGFAVMEKVMPQIDPAIIQNHFQMFMVDISQFFGKNQKRSHAAVKCAHRGNAAAAVDRRFQKHTDITFSGAVPSHLHIFRLQIGRYIICNMVAVLFPMAHIQPPRTAHDLPFFRVPAVFCELCVV